MNKILIPALLVATVMVAGMFAFAPVEQASTVHTTGLASGATSTVHTVAFVDTESGTVVFTCGDSAGCILQEMYIMGDGTVTATLTTMDLDVDGTGNIELEAGMDNVIADNTDITEVVADSISGERIVVPAGDTLTITVTVIGVAGDVFFTTVSTGSFAVSNTLA